jgi:predicted sulfurtransferase
LISLITHSLPHCPTPPSTFIDIGSSRGSAILTAAIEYNDVFAKCVGIEIDASLHNLAAATKKEYDRLYSGVYSNIQFIHGDAFSPLHKSIYATPNSLNSLVYCCCTAFPPSLIDTLSSTLSTLLPGTVVITLTYALSSRDFTILSKTNVKTDWSDNVTAFIQTPKKRKIILFYKYVALNPTDASSSQSSLCNSLNLTGRIRLSSEGINGTLCGSPSSINAYIAAMSSFPQFADITYKTSHSSTDVFNHEMLVRVTKEITSCGDKMGLVKPAADGGGGKHISPDDFHEAISNISKLDNNNKVLIDTRNVYETNTGTFKNAIIPSIRTFAQFPSWIESNKTKLAGKDVYMFCTGGIRCEKASSYLDSLGLCANVSQLEGGIHSYLEKFSAEARDIGGVGTEKGGDETNVAITSSLTTSPPTSLWEGTNFTFDSRLADRTAGSSGTSPNSKCCYCGEFWEVLKEEVVCKVCCDMILLCDGCKNDTALRAMVAPHGDDNNFAPEKPLEVGGVNFEKRVNAERNSRHLCNEHMIMDDNRWRDFLALLEKNGLERWKLERALKQIKKQLKASKGRGGKARRRALQLQIERLEDFFGKNAAARTAVTEDDEYDEASAEDEGEDAEWVDFFPLLSLWNP